MLHIGCCALVVHRLDLRARQFGSSPIRATAAASLSFLAQCQPHSQLEPLRPSCLNIPMARFGVECAVQAARFGVHLCAHCQQPKRFSAGANASLRVLLAKQCPDALTTAPGRQTYGGDTTHSQHLSRRVQLPAVGVSACCGPPKLSVYRACVGKGVPLPNRLLPLVVLLPQHPYWRSFDLSKRDCR
mmetsp:Transcript_6053/g.18607  ORF Transcript_6053/g.18607 Transcript_6053/m.18607 type:complete len:187 (-) Transcript_6053:247-807(-)